MLGKLIKYEFKALGRILFPLYGAVLILGIISSLFNRFDLPGDMVVLPLLIITYFFTLFGSGIMCFVLSIIRFKKNLLDDEGYLMHTLPVSKSQLVFSKVITATVMQILGITASALSGAFAVMFTVEEFPSYIEDTLSIIPASMSALGALGAETVLIGVVSLISFNLMIYASLSIGYSRNSRKMLCSVGVFIGFHFVSQIITQCYTRMMPHAFNEMLISGTTEELFVAMQPWIFAVLLLQIFYAAVYFFITSYSLKRKLNI